MRKQAKKSEREKENGRREGEKERTREGEKEKRRNGEMEKAATERRRE